MFNIDDPRRQNFIGKELEVVSAPNKDLQGLKGIIIDETSKTFKILTKNNEIKTILKKGTILHIGEWIINGDEIMKHPYQRIKMNIKEPIKTNQRPIKV